MHAIPTIITTTLVNDRRARFERSASRRRFTLRRQIPAHDRGLPAPVVHPLSAGRTPAGSAVAPTPKAA